MSIDHERRIRELEQKVANMRADIEAMVRNELDQRLTEVSRDPPKVTLSINREKRG
jgi:hypothetical protein